jgi:hypothetical protein
MAPANDYYGCAPIVTLQTWPSSPLAPATAAVIPPATADPPVCQYQHQYRHQYRQQPHHHDDRSYSFAPPLSLASTPLALASLVVRAPTAMTWSRAPTSSMPPPTTAACVPSHGLVADPSAAATLLPLDSLSYHRPLVVVAAGTTYPTSWSSAPSLAALASLPSPAAHTSAAHLVPTDSAAGLTQIRALPFPFDSFTSPHAAPDSFTSPHVAPDSFTSPHVAPAPARRSHRRGKRFMPASLADHHAVKAANLANIARHDTLHLVVKSQAPTQRHREDMLVDFNQYCLEIDAMEWYDPKPSTPSPRWRESPSPIPNMGL